MSWRVLVRPEAGEDVEGAAAWYDNRRDGLGDEFVEEVLAVYDALAENPLLNSRRLPRGRTSAGVTRSGFLTA